MFCPRRVGGGNTVNMLYIVGLWVNLSTVHPLNAKALILSTTLLLKALNETTYVS